MNFAFWGIALLFFGFGFGDTRLNVCGMTEKEIHEFPINRDTIIHCPFKQDISCKEYALLDDHVRISFSMCNYLPHGMNMDDLAYLWWNDARWDIVYSKCAQTYPLYMKNPITDFAPFKPSNQISLVLDVCSITQTEVENAVINRSTRFLFDQFEATCDTILNLSFQRRTYEMRCEYIKPEKRSWYSSGYAKWYDVRGALVYAKCEQLLAGSN